MSTGPMQGLRVLDFSIALTGPYAAALLADQGAEVIKVERPGIGDIARWVGVSVNGMSSLYLVCNRGKRSIALDIQTPAGAEIARSLASQGGRRDSELSARRDGPVGTWLRAICVPSTPTSSTHRCRDSARWAPTATAAPTTP